MPLYRNTEAMPEITIKYTGSKTLKVLIALSEYLGFVISKPQKKEQKGLIYINGIAVVPGDRSIDISDMSELISNNNMDAKRLRNDAWQRNK